MSITNNNFVSFDKLHYINVVINKQTAYFKIHYYNEDNMKTFLELFKDVVSFLHKNNIINIRQEVSINEVSLFKNSFIYERINNELVYMETNINNFVDEFYSVLGLK
jgi:hypothetical protein